MAAANAAAVVVEDVQVITRGEPDPERRSQSSHEKRAARNSRVHFGDFEDVDASMLPECENQPLIAESAKEETHKTVTAYFGFLQEAHRYQVKFGIPLDEIKSYVMSRDDKLEVKNQPGNSRLLQMSWQVDDKVGLLLQLLMELEIHSVLSFEDQFTIRSEAVPNRYIHVRIAAQVLGKGMGTPTLKYGVKCLGHCRSSESPPGSPSSSNVTGSADTNKQVSSSSPKTSAT